MPALDRVAAVLLACAMLAGAARLSAADLPAVAPEPCHVGLGDAGAAEQGYQITRTAIRQPSGAADVCEVDAQLPSAAVFRVAMPLAGWNGALIEARCGVECQQSPERICDSVVARGYACLAAAATAATSTSAAAHQRLIAAKAIVAAYYRSAPQAAVLLACSAGAGTGLHQAADFPADFQGIVAGAPIFDAEQQRQRLQWLADTLRARRGKHLLSQNDLARLHEHALAACDASDGLADRLISDPLRCQVPVRALQCAGPSDKSCLHPDQIEAIERVYAGPPEDPAAGQLPGSELGWAQLTTPAGRSPARSAMSAVQQPDLRKFAAAGGKLLLFQGLADPLVAPRQTAQLYERYTHALGGSVKATGYVRLFMIPGMQHCIGGEGPYQVDYLRGIENWTVKARRAPDDLIAFHPRSEKNARGSLFAPVEIDPAHKVFSSWQVGVSVTLAESRDHPQSRFSRPIYVYPVHTHYKGVGDPDVWRSFYGPNDYPYLLQGPP